VFILLPPVRKRLFPTISSYAEKAYLRIESISIIGPPLLSARKFISKRLHALLVSVVLVNIFIVPEINDLALVIITALWLFVLRKYEHDHRESFAVGLGLLLIAPIALQLNHNEIAEKAAVWAYMFFVAGAVQIFLELRARK
jgi:hypothetical protein